MTTLGGNNHDVMYVSEITHLGHNYEFWEAMLYNYVLTDAKLCSIRALIHL